MVRRVYNPPPLNDPAGSVAAQISVMTVEDFVASSEEDKSVHLGGDSSRMAVAMSMSSITLRGPSVSLSDRKVGA